MLYKPSFLTPIINLWHKLQVEIDVVKGKSVLLFISGLYIPKDDISILEPIFEKTWMEEQYKIVWIPLVEQSTNDLEKKFGILPSKMYKARYTLPIASTIFIKK